MIQANQLRVNNWVNLDDGTGISADYRQIKGITETSVTCLVKGCKKASSLIDNKLIYPIPLTEEILLKCGFEEIYRSEFSVRFELPSNPQIEYKWNWAFGWNLYCETWCIENIKHLHQLQNAIYFITGKELEIKF